MDTAWIDITDALLEKLDRLNTTLDRLVETEAIVGEELTRHHDAAALRHARLPALAAVCPQCREQDLFVLDTGNTLLLRCNHCGWELLVAPALEKQVSDSEGSYGNGDA